MNSESIFCENQKSHLIIAAWLIAISQFLGTIFIEGYWYVNDYLNVDAYFQQLSGINYCLLCDFPVVA